MSNSINISEGIELFEMYEKDPKRYERFMEWLEKDYLVRVTSMMESFVKKMREKGLF